MRETFVGNTIFTDEEKETMFGELRRPLLYACLNDRVSLDRRYNELFFVVLVVLTKDWESGEERWMNYVIRSLIGTYADDQSAFNKCYRLMRKALDPLFESGRIFSFKGTDSKKYARYYYTTITSHAMAPRNSYMAFFELAWNFYLDDLEQEYEEDDPLFEMFKDRLKIRIMGEDDSIDEDLSLGSESYALKASIKGLVVYEEKIFMDLLKEVVLCIHRLFNNEPIEWNSYLHELLINWWIKKSDELGKLKERKRGEKTAKSYAEIKARYFMNGGEAVLKVSPFFLHENFDEEPLIEIFCGEKVHEGFMLTEGYISPKTKSFYMPLHSFKGGDLKSMRIVISHKGKVIFDSKDNLNREFIMLGDYGEIPYSECLPGSYYLYDPYGIGKNVHDLFEIGIDAYSFVAEEGDTLSGKTKFVFFYDELGEEEFRILYKKEELATFVQDGEEYEIIDGDLFVEMPASYEAKEYGVRYSESDFLKLQDFPSIQIGEKRRYNITAILDVASPQTISLFKYLGNQNLVNKKLVKFKNIRISFDKDYYFGNDSDGIATFKTDKYNLSTPFSILKNEAVYIKVEHGEVKIKPPVVAFSLGGGEWKNTPIKEILWYKDFDNGTLLEATFPPSRNFRIFLEDEELPPKNREYGFGRLLYYYAGRSKGNKVSLYLHDATKKIKMAEIAIKPHLINNELTVDKNAKKVFFSPSSFIGGKGTRLNIAFIDLDEITAKEETFSSSEEVCFDLSSLPDGYYRIRITYRPNIFLGSSVLIYGDKEFGFGHFEKHLFDDRYIGISRALIIRQDGRKNSVNISKFLIKDVKYLQTIGDKFYYQGTLVYKLAGPNAADPILRSVEINPVLISTRGKTTCEISRGFRFTEDGGLGSIGRFVINNNGQLSLPKKGGKYTQREVVFFMMEVKKNV